MRNYPTEADLDAVPAPWGWRYPFPYTPVARTFDEWWEDCEDWGLESCPMYIPWTVAPSHWER